MIVGVASLATQGMLQADGFHLAGQAPEAVGKGNAFVATANTAAAVYYNAAGLTQLDAASVQAGFYSIDLNVSANLDLGGSQKLKTGIVTAPQIYGAVPINEDFVLGFGLNTPFGLSGEWGLNNSFRQITTQAELEYATFWLVGGYKVSETLSVGGGIGVHSADVDLRRGLAPSPSSDEFSFKGDDFGVSWTLSALWQPSAKHSLGIVYRSKTEFDLEGTTRSGLHGVSAASSVDGFVTPDTLAVGYSYRPNACWNIEANIEWVGWSKLGTMTLSSRFPGPLAALNTLPLPYEWEDSYIYSIGAEYDLGDGWKARFGYNFIESAQPDANYDPSVADADRHWLTLGVGHQGESWSWDAAYQYAFSDRSVGAAASPLVQGDYKSRFHSLSVSARYEF